MKKLLIPAMRFCSAAFAKKNKPEVRGAPILMWPAPAPNAPQI